VHGDEKGKFKSLFGSWCRWCIGFPCDDDVIGMKPPPPNRRERVERGNCRD
jgi:hypothetical protein